MDFFFFTVLECYELLRLQGTSQATPVHIFLFCREELEIQSFLEE